MRLPCGGHAGTTGRKLAAASGDYRRDPAPEELFRDLERLDAKRTPEDIGVSSADLDKLLRCSPLVRNRLTLMRARRMIIE